MSHNGFAFAWACNHAVASSVPGALQTKVMAAIAVRQRGEATVAGGECRGGCRRVCTALCVLHCALCVCALCVCAVAES